MTSPLLNCPQTTLGVTAKWVLPSIWMGVVCLGCGGKDHRGCWKKTQWPYCEKLKQSQILEEGSPDVALQAMVINELLSSLGLLRVPSFDVWVCLVVYAATTRSFLWLVSTCLFARASEWMRRGSSGSKKVSESEKLSIIFWLFDCGCPLNHK